MDIVERLKGPLSHLACNEAASTIEALRHERDELLKENERLGKGIEDITFRYSGGLRAYEQLAASKETVRYAEYILNHYSRNSHADHLVLARHLEAWAERQCELEQKK